MNEIKEWCISDTHFWHDRIIEYCKRPFNNVQEMNNHIIKEWNLLVGENDIVYHAGDFGFGSKDQIKEILSQLNGNIILIVGNHDKFGRSKYIECGFSEIYKKKLQLGNIIITHVPLEDVPIDYINLHGHIHNTYIEEFDTEQHVNISADVLNFKPILISDIIAGKYIRLTKETGLIRQNKQKRH